jgi:excisionase family DNA binding protein
MLTVPEAARRVRCNPETVRRWIRSGRLPSRRAGTQHLIEEADLLMLVPPAEIRLPAAWRRTATGEPMPAVVRAVRRSREGR